MSGVVEASRNVGGVECVVFRSPRIPPDTSTAVLHGKQATGFAARLLGNQSFGSIQCSGPLNPYAPRNMLHVRSTRLEDRTQSIDVTHSSAMTVRSTSNAPSHQHWLVVHRSDDDEREQQRLGREYSTRGRFYPYLGIAR